MTFYAVMNSFFLRLPGGPAINWWLPGFCCAAHLYFYMESNMSKNEIGITTGIETNKLNELIYSGRIFQKL